MLKIKSLKPYSTKIDNKKGKIVFDYKYLIIIKDGEPYNFIPIESKEIVFNLNTLEIENTNDIFVFQRRNKFLRMSLMDLLRFSDIRKHLKPVFESIILEYDFDSIYDFGSDSEIVTFIDNEETEYDEDMLSIFLELKTIYIYNEIDRALLEGNKEMFDKLINLLEGNKEMFDKFINLLHDLNNK